MSTQLRLVDTPPRAPGSRTGRRAVRWPDWRLDPQARAVGRNGVARARAALEQAGRTDRPADPERRLPRAS